MGSKSIQPCQNGANLKRLTNQQQMFVYELLADNEFNIKRAAKKAGYKNPSQSANQLLTKNRYVARALGKAQRERQERCELTGDDVLNYLKDVLYLNPLNYFYPSADGDWTIKDLSSLPEKVGRLIESFELKVIETEDGQTISTFKVKLASKSNALALAMRHTTVDKQEITHVINWDSILQTNKAEVNIIEARLIEEEKKALIKEKLKPKPKPKGE